MQTARILAPLAAILTLTTSHALAQDSDGDGIPDSLDTCPGFDDTVDNYGAIGYNFEYAFPLDAQGVPQQTNLAGDIDLALNNTADIPTPLGRGVAIDGSTSTVLLPDAPETDALDDGSFTVLFNIRTAPGEFGIILTKLGDNFEIIPLFVQIGGDTQSINFIRKGEAIELPIYGGFGSITVNDGQWHHVAIVYDRSNGAHVLYIDGQFQDIDGAGYHAAAHSSQPLVIGGTVEPADGTLTPGTVAMDFEDFYILAQVLDEAQVQTVAQNGFANGIPDACDPLCPADLNGDGILDNGDIGAFITAFLTADLAADFNNDGILDNGDIGAFVAAFLAGC